MAMIKSNAPVGKPKMGTTITSASKTHRTSGDPKKHGIKGK